MYRGDVSGASEKGFDEEVNGDAILVGFGVPGTGG